MLTDLDGLHWDHIHQGYPRLILTTEAQKKEAKKVSQVLPKSYAQNNDTNHFRHSGQTDSAF